MITTDPHRYLISLAAIACAFGFAPSAFAARPGTNSVRILVTQLQENVDLVDAKGTRKLGTTTDKQLPVELSPRDLLQIRIHDPNPIYYTYTADVVQTGETASYASAGKFAAAIGDFLKNNPTRSLDVSGEAASEVGLTIGDIHASTLASNLVNIQNAQKQVEEAVRASRRGDAAAVAEAKEKLPEAIKNVDDILNDAEKLAKLEAQGVIAKTPLAFSANPKILEHIQNRDRIYSLADLALALSNAVNLATTDVAADTELSTLLRELHAAQWLLQNKSEIAALRSFLHDFAEVYAGVLKPLDVPPAIRYDPAHDRKLTLHIGINKTFLGVLRDIAPDLGAAPEKPVDIEFPLAPEEKYSLEIGAGAIYSFIRNSEFAVKQNSAGQLLITEKESDYSGVDGAVVLNISKASLKGYGVRPFVQIGVVPSSDKTAVLLGAGLHGYDRFTISLGAIYQRTNTLAAGLKVGQQISSTDDLKQDHHFKAGLFVMIGVATE